MRLVALIATGMLTAASLAPAEEAVASRNGSGTTLSLQVGLTSGTMDMPGAALGGTLVQDLGSRVSVEASASSVGQGMGSNAVSASASLLFNLRASGGKAVPYLSLGGGLYRTSFDMRDGRYGMEGSGMGGWGMGGRGMMGGWVAPGNVGPRQVANTDYMYGHMPEFYRSRFPTAMDPAADMRSHRSFTDPAVSMGGGVRIELGKSWFIRPDGRALIVMSNGDSYTVGVVTVNFGWKF